MGGVGLLLVDVRRRAVDEIRHVVVRSLHAIRAGRTGRAVDDHEVGRSAGGEERVILGDRDDDEAVLALLDEVEAVIEELAEEGHVGVDRSGESFIRRSVGDEVLLGASNVRADGLALLGRSRSPGRGIVGRLVDDEMTDQAGGVVLNGLSAVVGGTVIGRPELAGHRVGERLVRATEVLLAREQVVVGTVDRPEAPRNSVVREDVHQPFAGSMAFRDLDLLEDEDHVFNLVRQVACCTLLLRARVARERPGGQRERQHPGGEKDRHDADTRKNSASIGSHCIAPQHSISNLRRLQNRRCAPLTESTYD